MDNFYKKYDWKTMMNMFPAAKTTFKLSDYYNLLCPKDDYPEFLDKYLELPVLQRLKGVGLLCGSDWTKLFNNNFFYSRFDHSLGVALIVWHFTHNKAQTIAGLLHDISTPVFSHVSDFRKGDALTQTVTEGPTAFIIRNNKELQKLLHEDGLTSAEVEDYHIYPVADNEIPQLSADRLEYMFPSGLALFNCWTMEEIDRCYKNIKILKNEQGIEELGFTDIETAELYCQKFCLIGHLLQLNEDKLTLHMLGIIMNKAVEKGILEEKDFMELTEAQVMDRIENADLESKGDYLFRLYNTFRNMTQIEHTDTPLNEADYFCVSLKVKQRYINPLVGDGVRLYEKSEKARILIDDFKTFEDTACGCVKLL